MRDRLCIIILVVAAGFVALVAPTPSRVHLTKIEERDSSVTFLLHNDTRQPLVTEFVGIVEPSSRGPFSNALTRAFFVEPGSNRVMRVSGVLSPSRRFMVMYRHRVSAFEKRMRRWGASARLCSEYPPAKELLCIYYP
jgi:hypothetical protein